MLLLDQTSSIASLINRLRVTRFTAAAIFVMAVLATAAIPRTSWPLNAVTFFIAAGVFLAVAGSQKKKDVRFWIGVGILTRALLVPVFPELSDDIYRFLWDGQMILAGDNPYGVVPTDWITQHEIQEGYLAELTSRMNSPGYYTVYPPISQLLFTIAAWCGGDSMYLSAVILKLFLFASEVGTIALLLKVLPARRTGAVLLYAINPLPMIEIVGNVHFEGLMILSLVLAYWLITLPGVWNIRRSGALAGAFALGIGVKLLPLAVFPFLWRRLGTKIFMTTAGILLVILACIFVPPLSTSGVYGTSTSLELYFQRFEFNASIYYILRWIGYLWKGYNMIHVIGVITGLATLAAYAALFFVERRPRPESWATVSLIALCIYLGMSSIVHPWYVVTLVALAVLSDFRYPILWSITVFLSYSAYASADYSENLWLVALEYIPVYFMAGFELLLYRKSRTSVK